MRLRGARGAGRCVEELVLGHGRVHVPIGNLVVLPRRHVGRSPLRALRRRGGRCRRGCSRALLGHRRGRCRTLLSRRHLALRGLGLGLWARRRGLRGHLRRRTRLRGLRARGRGGRRGDRSRTCLLICERHRLARARLRQSLGYRRLHIRLLDGLEREGVLLRELDGEHARLRVPHGLRAQEQHAVRGLFALELGKRRLPHALQRRGVFHGGRQLRVRAARRSRSGSGRGRRGRRSGRGGRRDRSRSRRGNGRGGSRSRCGRSRTRSRLRCGRRSRNRRGGCRSRSRRSSRRSGSGRRGRGSRGRNGRRRDSMRRSGRRSGHGDPGALQSLDALRERGKRQVAFRAHHARAADLEGQARVG